MKASKLTTKYQTTVPKEVRDALDLKPGDFVAFEIENEKIIFRKVSTLDLEYVRALESTLLQEWNSSHDDAAYRNL